MERGLERNHRFTNFFVSQRTNNSYGRAFSTLVTKDACQCIPKKANVVKKTVYTDQDNVEISLHDSFLRINKYEVIHQLGCASMATGVARTHLLK